MTQPDRVLITGASAGIGEATARFLAREGFEVVLASEQPEALRQVRDEINEQGGRAVAVDLDLLDSEQVESFIDRVEEEVGFCSVLVNNAGIGLHKTLLESTDTEFQRVFQINFFAMVTLTRRALRSMIEHQRGHIVNISSAGARRSLGRMTCYGASKGAMHCFSQALRLEVAAHSIAVTEILPISVRTSFFKTAGYQPRGLVQTPDTIARLVSRALRTREAELCSSKVTWLSFILDTIAPNFTSQLLDWHRRWQERKS